MPQTDKKPKPKKGKGQKRQRKGKKEIPLTKGARKQMREKAPSPLLQTLLLPGESRPIRMADNNPRQTALFSFRQQATVTAPITGTSFLVFKDAAFPLWGEVQYLSTQQASTFYYQGFSGTGAAGFMTCPVTVGSSVPLEFNYNSDVYTFAGNTIVGDVMPYTPGLSGSTGWWYVPQGLLPCVELGTSVPITGGTWSMEFQYSASGALTDTKSVVLDAAPSGTLMIVSIGSATVTSGGWYRVVALECVGAVTASSATTIGYYRVGYTTGTSLSGPTALGTATTCYQPVTGIGAAEISVAPMIYEEARINASSFLFQNSTNMLNEDGKIDATVVDIRGRKPWASRAQNVTYLSDTVKELRYSGLARNGLYTFTTIGMSDDTMIDFVAGVANKPAFVLDRTIRYYFIQVVPNLAAQTFNLISDIHHETVNDSMLFPTGVSRMSLEEAHAAKVASAVLRPFTENPIHIPALIQAARRMGMAAWAFARPRMNPWAHKAVDYFLPPRQLM